MDTPPVCTCDQTTAGVMKCLIHGPIQIAASRSKPDPPREPIIDVDATPDADYPLRILRAYRANCDIWFSADTQGIGQTLACRIMNKTNVARATILDKAIKTLETQRMTDIIYHLRTIETVKEQPCAK